MNKNSISQRSETDWDRVKNIKDEEIDFSDIPRLTPEMFARGMVRKGLKPVSKKRQLTLRLDEEVIEFFKTDGIGYQTRINALLRAYMEAHIAK